MWNKIMWVEYNPNPVGNLTGDCSVRAIAKALNIDWDTAHDLTAYTSKMMGTIQNSNNAWGAVLRRYGFIRRSIPDSCPDCYTAEDFCQDHPYGIYVLGFGSHVATVEDGILYDSWDSSQEVPQYYWAKKER